MTARGSDIPEQFATFGELLRYLRRREGLTQRELSIAVGYSEAQISRLEQNQRLPDVAVIRARFVPALHLEGDTKAVQRLEALSLTAEAAPQHNLPAQLTSFIGRERALMDVRRLLSEARLVTLTGPGGCGKTRLALSAAAAVMPDYPGGVWLAELAQVADPDRVAHQLVTVLNVRQDPGSAPAQALGKHLRDRHLLLLLDNCEHMVEACAALAETLLQACPKLRLLATSREVFGLAGEAAFRVPPLSLPPAEVREPPAPASLLRYEAVQLFVHRAAAVLPGFTLDERNASAVVQVCRRLDGLPLALELAAARVPVLSVEQIAARLDDRFSLLSGGRRTALPRHQTLQATLDWSYDLLPPAERILLQRMSVFAGGWTLEAAEAVGAGEGIDAGAVLGLLAQLVHKSLVIVQREPGPEPRYSLLETIREYALARLIELGGVTAVRQRHANYFLALVEAAQSSSSGPEGRIWLERLSQENGNLLSAFEWSLEHAPETGLRLVTSVWLFWRYISDLREGRRWLERVVNLLQAEGQAVARAEGFLAASVLARVQGDYQVARDLNEQCLAIWRQLNGGRPKGLPLAALGRVALAQGDIAGARQYLEDGLRLLEEEGNRWGCASAVMWYGHIAVVEGDNERARARYLEANALRGTVDSVARAMSWGYLGYLACREAKLAEARELFAQCFRTWRLTPDPWSIAWGLEGFAGVLVNARQALPAAHLYGAAEALLEHSGTHLDPFDRMDYERHLAALREQLSPAVLADAWAIGGTMAMDEAMTYALELAERDTEGEAR